MVLQLHTHSLLAGATCIVHVVCCTSVRSSPRARDCKVGVRTVYLSTCRCFVRWHVASATHITHTGHKGVHTYVRCPYIHTYIHTYMQTNGCTVRGRRYQFSKKYRKFKVQWLVTHAPTKAKQLVPSKSRHHTWKQCQIRRGTRTMGNTISPLCWRAIQLTLAQLPLGPARPSSMAPSAACTAGT